MALIEIWFRAIWKKIFFKIQRGGPLVQKKRFLLCRGVIFQKKKFCVFGSLSNMSKNGLRMVVSQNFDMTHLSPPSILGWHISRFCPIFVLKLDWRLLNAWAGGGVVFYTRGAIYKCYAVFTFTFIMKHLYCWQSKLAWQLQQ